MYIALKYQLINQLFKMQLYLLVSTILYWACFEEVIKLAMLKTLSLVDDICYVIQLSITGQVCTFIH